MKRRIVLFVVLLSSHLRTLFPGRLKEDIVRLKSEFANNLITLSIIDLRYLLSHYLTRPCNELRYHLPLLVRVSSMLIEQAILRSLLSNGSKLKLNLKNHFLFHFLTFKIELNAVE